MTWPSGTYAYLLAGGAFLLLALAVTIWPWRGRFRGPWLPLACVVTAGWGLALAHQAAMGYQPALTADFAELLRNAAWFVFLVALLPVFAGTGLEQIPRPLRLFLSTIGVLLVAVGGGIIIEHLDVGPLNLVTDYLASAAGFLLLSVAGLVLVEQVYRNAGTDYRWGIKSLCLGLGSLFAYDIYVYAHLLLFDQIGSAVWEARGFIAAMVVPLLAVSIARSRLAPRSLAFSRQFMFRFATLGGAGIYLLAMAGVGYYLRYAGGSWGGVLQITFLFGTVLLLAMVLFSGTFRARLQVWLSKHFFPYKYDYRDEWLQFINTLSRTEPGQSLRERGIMALAEIIDSTGGILWTRDENDRFKVGAVWNMGEPALPEERADSPLVEFMARREWVVDLDEYRNDPGLYENLTFPDWLLDMDRAWLVVPLMQLDRLQGFVVLARPRVARTINWEDRDLIKAAGRQLAAYIGLLDTTDALMDARQFDAFNRLSAYVVHDLKNVSAQLSLIVSNADRHRGNPEFLEDAVKTVASANDKLTRILAQLRKGQEAGTRSPTPFQVTEAARAALSNAEGRDPRPRLEIHCDDVLVRADREQFEAVLTHLVRNAQDATPAEGSVTVHIHAESGDARLEVVDTGSGMEERFIRERLFRPFDTTKGNAGMGIGVYEAREFANAHGGSLTVASRPGEGTRFTLTLPGCGQPSQNNHMEMSGEEHTGTATNAQAAGR